MSKQDFREEVQIFQELLNNAISEENNDLQDQYIKISNILDFIKNTIEPLHQNEDKYNNAIFIVGPTGAGKSTFINYLAGRELFFKTHNDNPGIFPNENDAIAYVGKGEGSTTIAPNIWRSQSEDFSNSTLIDWAGDNDSRGTIVNIINSKFKSILSKNVTDAKILFISSQDSISPSGSYGAIFKEGLEKTAQFLNEIDYFKENIGIIISHAGRIANTYKTIKACLNNVIINPSLEKYKNVLEYIINNENFAIFSKYSDDSSEGDIYTPPGWNLGQREKIIELIKKINYQKIPPNFFRDFSSSEVREQMSKAFDIVKSKTANSLKISLEKALYPKLVLHAIALKKFIENVENEIIYNKTESTLIKYIKKINDLPYLTLIPTEEIIKMNEEMKFLLPFIKPSPDITKVKLDWGTLINVNILFKDILDEAKIIIHDASDLFSCISEYNKIITIGHFPLYSQKLKEYFSTLPRIYIERENIKNSKGNEKYYFFETETKIIGITPVPYQESEPYKTIEYFKKEVPYEAIETVTKEIPYKVKESYIEQVPYEVVINNPERERLLQEFNNRPKKIGKGIFKHLPNIPFELMARLSELPEKITVIMYKDMQKEREVTKYQKITVDQKVIKYKQETEAKEVIKYRVVTKYHEIPEYQNVQVKKFNENKYNHDLTNIENVINDLKKIIKENLKEVKAINNQKESSYSPEILAKIIDQAKNEANNNPIKYDDFKNEYAEIYEEWKNAEYKASIIWEYELAGGTDIHYQ